MQRNDTNLERDMLALAAKAIGYAPLNTGNERPSGSAR